MEQFRLYLAREHTYCKRYILQSIDDAYNIINSLPEFDEYLIIREDLELHQDEVLAFGSIPHNVKKRKR